VDELAETLAGENQCLPCATPGFDGKATLGGSLACNLSGHTRPWAGSLRDLVLGASIINGKGEALRFGGQVMKNVAGYDVSRLQAGALGTLGVITEISFKVLPVPESETTLAYDCSAADALDTMLQRGIEPYPLAGACWFDGSLYLRLAGAAAAVNRAVTDWGGDRIDGTGPWPDLNAFALPFFESSAPLVRLSLPATSRLALDQDPLLLDWGGAQRWVHSDDVSAWARSADIEGGHAWQFRGGDRSGETAPPLSPALKALHRQLKQAMDPAGILNPGRLYGWL
jgi:glycolate oxidase FAD binding subunit